MTTPTTEIVWPQSAAEAAHNGATLLDEIKPGWADKINTEKLRMYDTQFCVLGQVYNPRSLWESGFYHATHTAKIFDPWIEAHTTEDYIPSRGDAQGYFGFNAGEFSDSISISDLTPAWRFEIASRTEQHDTPPTDTPPEVTE